MKLERKVCSYILEKITGKKHRVTENSVRKFCSKQVLEESGGKYTVRSAEELIWVAKMVNEEGYRFEGKVIELADDIDLTGYNWVPIGLSLKKAFCGVFDGCGKSVKGISVNREEPYVGFFGVVMGINKVLSAEICNIYLSDISVTGTASEAYVGGLVGLAVEGVIVEKCSVDGTIESEYCAGGLVGLAEDCVTVRRSSVRGKVIAGELTGTLIGRMMVNSVLRNSNSTVIDSYGCPEECLVGNSDDTSIIKECYY